LYAYFIIQVFLVPSVALIIVGRQFINVNKEVNL
jgi:hypothetical protein